jgi:hypothetical protein
MKKYVIFKRSESYNLSMIINEQLTKGGKLVGGVSVSRGGCIEDEYSQAMLIKTK